MKRKEKVKIMRSGTMGKSIRRSRTRRRRRVIRRRKMRIWRWRRRKR